MRSLLNSIRTLVLSFLGAPSNSTAFRREHTLRYLRFAWHTAVFFPVVLIIVVAISFGAPIEDVWFFGLCALGTVSLEACLHCVISKTESLIAIGELARDANDLIRAKHLTEQVRNQILDLRISIGKFGIISLGSMLAFSVLMAVEVRRMKNIETAGQVTAIDSASKTETDRSREGHLSAQLTHQSALSWPLILGASICATWTIFVSLVKVWITTREHHPQMILCRALLDLDDPENEHEE